MEIREDIPIYISERNPELKQYNDDIRTLTVTTKDSIFNNTCVNEVTCIVSTPTDIYSPYDKKIWTEKLREELFQYFNANHVCITYFGCGLDSSGVIISIHDVDETISTTMKVHKLVMKAVYDLYISGPSNLIKYEIAYNPFFNKKNQISCNV